MALALSTWHCINFAFTLHPYFLWASKEYNRNNHSSVSAPVSVHNMVKEQLKKDDLLLGAVTNSELFTICKL